MTRPRRETLYLDPTRDSLELTVAAADHECDGCEGAGCDDCDRTGFGRCDRCGEPLGSVHPEWDGAGMYGCVELDQEAITVRHPRLPDRSFCGDCALAAIHESRAAVRRSIERTPAAALPQPADVPKPLAERAELDLWERESERAPATLWKHRFQHAVAHLRFAEDTLRVVERKAAHGCGDMYCGLCDGDDREVHHG